MKFISRIFAFLKALFSRCPGRSRPAGGSYPQAVLPEETEERLTHEDWDQREVLVGTLRSEAQLRVCLEKCFYYIPAYLVEEGDRPIRYVALFQTPRVFPQKAGIYVYGEVLEERLVPRGSIREVPQTHGTPEEMYYRYQIRQWLPLEKPILPGEVGFVRAFTNCFLLEEAEYVPELLLASEEEYRLYRELKSRFRDGPSGFALGELRVTVDEKHIRMTGGAGKEAVCQAADFSKRPVTTFRTLYAEMLGTGEEQNFSDRLGEKGGAAK